MKTLHTIEQSNEIERQKQIVIDLFDSIITLGKEQIYTPIPNLKECNLQHCQQYNDSTNYNKLHSKEYSLLVQVNSCRELLLKHQNLIDLVQFNKDKNK